MGGQWTGKESALNQYSYALEAFISESDMLFRIVFESDQSVNQEGVVIDDFFVDGTALNTESFGLSQLAVYPNPSKDVFYIQLQNNNPYDLKVTDITGKRLFVKKNINPSTTYPLQMEGYSSGIYFLQIKVDNQQTTRKLILN